jgi:hypothetical protein
MLSLLLAAQLQLPVVTQDTLHHLVSGMSALSRESVTSARVALWISAEGKVRECRIIAFVGEQKDADLLCRKVLGARLSPALDGTGRPVPSLFTTVLGASADSGNHPATVSKWIDGALAPADFVINLSALPPSLAWNPRVAINVLVDQNGGVATCEADAAQVSQEWVEIACGEVRAGGLDPMTSEGSARVAYIRNLVVKFEVGE